MPDMSQQIADRLVGRPICAVVDPPNPIRGIQPARCHVTRRSDRARRHPNRGLDAARCYLSFPHRTQCDLLDASTLGTDTVAGFAKTGDRSHRIVDVLAAHSSRNARTGIVGTLAALSAFALTMTMLAGCASTGITADLVYYPSPPTPAHVVHLKSFDRLADLVPSQPSFLDMIRGTGAGPFVVSPAGIAYSNPNLYICDTGAGTVLVWNLATGEGSVVGGGKDAALVKPVAVAVEDGAVYVADTGRGEVVAFGADGNPLRSFKPDDRDAYQPVAVAVRRGKLFVADIAAHAIDVFSTIDGAHRGSFGSPGGDLGDLYFPTGVATDVAGRVYVSEMMNGRVQVFDTDGEAMLAMGQPGDRYGDMAQPKHLAVGPDGVIFIADAQFARVHLFDGEGRFLMLLGGGDGAFGNTPMPLGVTVAPMVPDNIAALVPIDFAADYYVFVSNRIGPRRLGLFAVGSANTVSP